MGTCPSRAVDGRRFSKASQPCNWKAIQASLLWVGVQPPGQRPDWNLDASGRPHCGRVSQPGPSLQKKVQPTHSSPPPSVHTKISERGSMRPELPWLSSMYKVVIKYPNCRPCRLPAPYRDWFRATVLRTLYSVLYAVPVRCTEYSVAIHECGFLPSSKPPVSLRARPFEARRYS
jgi:hypothetical protein